MQHIDLKQTFKYLYSPSAREVSIIDIPEMPLLMIDGAGNPNTAPAYAEAIEALYAVAYTLKFMLKRPPTAIESVVMPLEGLWWSDDMATFSVLDKDSWRWTAMIAQPDAVSAELFREAVAQATQKKGLPALTRLRLERFCEGRVAQIMHLGPYAAEAPTIERLHCFIEEHGYAPHGKHHEIYLSDPRRSEPEKMKTIIRQPVLSVTQG